MLTRVYLSAQSHQSLCCKHRESVEVNEGFVAHLIIISTTTKKLTIINPHSSKSQQSLVAYKIRHQRTAEHYKRLITLVKKLLEKKSQQNHFLKMDNRSSPRVLGWLVIYFIDQKAGGQTGKLACESSCVFGGLRINLKLYKSTRAVCFYYQQ